MPPSPVLPIQVFFIDASLQPCPIAQFIDTFLAILERRIVVTHFASANKVSRLCYLLLAHVLQRNLGYSVPFTIQKTKEGKPLLPDNRYFFSVSHYRSGLAVSTGPINHGIDAELIRPLPEAVVRRFFSAPDQEALKNCGDPMLSGCRMWTGKEALTKLLGIPLARHIGQMETGSRHIRLQEKAFPCQTFQLPGGACLSVVSEPGVNVPIELFSCRLTREATGLIIEPAAQRFI